MSPVRLALFASILTISAVSGLAHTRLASSSPEAGEALTEAPAEVELRFEKPVRVPFCSIEVDDPDGHDARSTPAVRSDEPTVLSVPLKPDRPDGVFEVRWRVVSLDGHVLEGEFQFEVRIPSE